MGKRKGTLNDHIRACIERIGWDLVTHERIRACVQEQRPDLRVPHTIITQVLKTTSIKLKRHKLAKVRPGHRVMIEDVEYRSIRQAAAKHNLTPQGVIYRLKSAKHPRWVYVVDAVAQDNPVTGSDTKAGP